MLFIGTIDDAAEKLIEKLQKEGRSPLYKEVYVKINKIYDIKFVAVGKSLIPALDYPCI